MMVPDQAHRRKLVIKYKRRKGEDLVDARQMSDETILTLILPNATFA